MLAIGCMFALRFALPSARNKALMGRLGVGLRVVVGGYGRWRWHSVCRVHVCFACLVLSYCPLGHYAVKRYLSHRKGKGPRGAEVPEWVPLGLFFYCPGCCSCVLVCLSFSCFVFCVCVFGCVGAFGCGCVWVDGCR